MLEIILQSLLRPSNRSVNVPKFKLDLFVVWLKLYASLESFNSLKCVTNAYASHCEDVVYFRITGSCLD